MHRPSERSIDTMVGAQITGNVAVRLPGNGNSNSHDARTVHLIITMIKWIWASRLSMQNSVCRTTRGRTSAMEDACARGFVDRNEWTTLNLPSATHQPRDSVSHEKQPDAPRDSKLHHHTISPTTALVPSRKCVHLSQPNQIRPPPSPNLTGGGG